MTTNMYDWGESEDQNGNPQSEKQLKAN